MKPGEISQAHHLITLFSFSFFFFMQDMPVGIQITAAYLFLLILQSHPILRFKNTFFGIKKYVCFAVIVSSQVSVTVDMRLISVYNFNASHPRWHTDYRSMFILINSTVRSTTSF